MSADPDPVADLVGRINATGAPKAVLYVAGGGSEIFPMILVRGGGSATLLGGRLLYGTVDFRQAIGHDPGRLVTPKAAGSLAMAAFRHALAVRDDLDESQVFGLGSTSKLARGQGEREGRSHAIHAAVQDSRRTTRTSATLPGEAGRPWQERINALLLLDLIAGAKGEVGSVALQGDGLALAAEALTTRTAGVDECGGSPVEDLLVGRRGWVALGMDSGTPRPDTTAPRLLLPGSFNPLHEGHRAMAEAASRMAGLPCDFEISLTHPEKPAIDYLDLRSRLTPFLGQGGRVVLTTAPTYLEKARLFPGCTFVVGHDTALRIVDPRFYGGPAGRDAALDELERLGTRFLAFGRVDSTGAFRDLTPDEFEGPVSGFLARVATPVPAEVFRLDISSTEIRLGRVAEFDAD